MTEFHDWENIRAELDDGDAAALNVERDRTEAWVSAFHRADEQHENPDPTQRQVEEGVEGAEA